MKQRKCNQYGCDGVMKPTRKMWTLSGEVKSPDHRTFECTKCGNQKPWLDVPSMNGCFGELHMRKDLTASGLSMLSDPIFYPPKRKRPQRGK
jgi:hypothetical protein